MKGMWCCLHFKHKNAKPCVSLSKITKLYHKSPLIKSRNALRLGNINCQSVIYACPQITYVQFISLENR